MAVRRGTRRAVEGSSGPVLPPELADGPDPVVWAPEVVDDPQLADGHARRRWLDAGSRWGTVNAFRDWQALLPEDVRQAASALGYMARWKGGRAYPWERGR